MYENNHRTDPQTLPRGRGGHENPKDTITFERRTLNASQLVGQSSNELIFRHYNRKGFKVLDIGKTDKLNVTLDLSELADAAGEV